MIPMTHSVQWSKRPNETKGTLKKQTNMTNICINFSSDGHTDEMTPSTPLVLTLK